MLIEVKKQVTEAVEVKLPFYGKSNFAHCMVNEQGDLIVVRDNQITVYESTSHVVKASILDHWEESAECSKEEFYAAFKTTAQQLGQYADKMIKVIDFAIPQTETIY